MANAKRWNIVETRVIETHKDADGGKCVNNYALLRTLGQGRFAKVKLVERIPPPPAPPAIATPVSNPSSDADAPLPAMPPGTAPLRPTFAQPPPAAAPRRQFAMKIFSKAMLSKMKDYVSQGAPRQQSDAESPRSSPSLPPPQPHSQFPSSSMRVVTALDRMRDEVRIMRTLYHRNIVLLFEVIEAETSDKIYLVLEYMPQGPCMVFRPDTKDFVSPITKSVLTDDLARAHTLDILHGLEYLHARGICHRDLKPDNILLNATGRCHISDFGCALMKPSATAPLHVADTVGTYQFLSPESCSGELYDPFLTDIWAVGVILFVFLFGTLPFQGETTRELFDAIVECDLVVPDDKRPVSSECRDLLVRLLSKEASQRISIADALQHPWLCAKGDDEDEPPSF